MSAHPTWFVEYLRRLGEVMPSPDALPGAPRDYYEFVSIADSLHIYLFELDEEQRRQRLRATNRWLYAEMQDIIRIGLGLKRNERMLTRTIAPKTAPDSPFKGPKVVPFPRGESGA